MKLRNISPYSVLMTVGLACIGLGIVSGIVSMVCDFVFDLSSHQEPKFAFESEHL